MTILLAHAHKMKICQGEREKIWNKKASGLKFDPMHLYLFTI